MAAEVKRLGIVLTAEGAEDFASELKNCSNALRDNRDQLNLAKSAYDKNTSSLEKLADKQQFASKQVEAYTAKVEVLSRQLEDMKASGDASAATIAKQEHNLNQAKIQLCAQPRVCSLTGGSPVYPRPNQPDISESWDGISNDA